MGIVGEVAAHDRRQPRQPSVGPDALGRQAQGAAAVEVEVLLERHRVRLDLSAEAWQEIVQIRFEAAVAQWTFEREFDKFRGFVTAGAKGHVILDPSPD